MKNGIKVWGISLSVALGIGVGILLASALWVPKALAYEAFQDGCVSCHTIFAGGPTNDIHNKHATLSNSDCASCHGSSINNNPPLANCVRCHGRAGDAGGDNISPGLGRGLRQHHQWAGQTICSSCHADATGPAGVGENVQPSYYPGPAGLNSCNGSEEQFPSKTVSLDNDGDGLTDGADPDCAGGGINQPPAANAGPDQTRNVGNTIILDGSGSSDPDGDSLTYSWSLTTVPAGSAAVLKGATTVNPTFVADVAGTYVAQLIVNDSTVDSAPDTVTITIIAGSADFDIQKFNVKPKKVKLDKPKPFRITVKVKNSNKGAGSVTASETRLITVTGVQNHNNSLFPVYTQTMSVTIFGKKKALVEFPPYTPTTDGDITWTATIPHSNLDVADIDEATAVTKVFWKHPPSSPTPPPVVPEGVVWPCPTSTDNGTPKITNKHGESVLLHSGEFVDACKFFVQATITSATANEAGAVTVDFTVKDENGNPVVGVPSISANIAKLVPASGDNSFSQWVPYIYQTETVSGDIYPNPDGTTVERGYRESNGTLADHGDGSYTYAFATNIANVVAPVSGTPITYDRTLTHRVSIMMGGHSGPTADAVFDFVPDGSSVTQTRDIVQTTACYACHGEKEFSGHGGDRLTVENCVTCHNPAGKDAQSGNTIDMKVMLHKIHIGGELPSIEDAVANSPTAENVWQLTDAERADLYAIWGHNDTKATWWKVEFPAVIENCTKCHQGTGAQVDNWKNVPSRQACGSCHDDVDFASGTNHGGGAQASDAACSGCHPPAGSGFGQSVMEAHNWLAKDPRNIPEYQLDLTVSTPANGKYFVAGESPVVTLVIKLNGTPIDHTLITKGAATGCPDPFGAGCEDVTGDYAFNSIYLFVHGPRAARNPVLTPAADAKILSSSAGPFDLSTAVDLKLRVDNEVNISVAVSGAAQSATATPTDIMNWLNADAGFAARAIAYLAEGGKVAIRSRNIGKFFALQLLASDVNTVVFNNDTTVNVPDSFYPSNDLADQAAAQLANPGVTYAPGGISYPLDPVDDLKSGTYVASIQLANAGRVNDSNYRTPSVAKTTFQVKQEAEEPAVASNCGSCHQGPNGTGYVLDYPRHNKIFDNTAIDQCGACHDYQPQSPTGAGWSGARPISKRVHAVHHGSELNYPEATVDHADTVPGRNWDIEFPQDIRTCDKTCHPDGSTGAPAVSGSWKTEAARLPCSGCHDADETATHMKLQTYDPTPADPWSGDEVESCKVCHQ